MMNHKRFSLFVLFLLVLVLLPLVTLAQNNAPTDTDSAETLLEQAMARAAEREAALTGPAPLSASLAAPNVAYPLFIGVDDVDAIPAYQVDVITNNFLPAFSGAQVWGAAYDESSNIVYFNNGSQLYEWPLGGAINLLGTIVDPGGATQAMVGLAFYNGQLYSTKNIANEAIWAINPSTLVATVFIDYVDADLDCGGFAADPNTGTFYCANDDATPHGTGLFIINPDASVTLVAPYPAGQTDIDGLAISKDGYAYLVIDEPGFIYVYDLVGGAYVAPLNNPWTSSEIFSAGAWIWSPFGCNAPVEGFEGSILPAGWSVQTGEPAGPQWGTLTACGEGGNYTNGAGGAACVSSDLFGAAEMDTSLVTPVFDLTGFTTAELAYTANYQNFAALDFLDVDISANGGITWTTLLSWNEDHGAFRTQPGEDVTIDLSAYAGQSGLMLRWRYYDPNTGDWNWYAQIDDVSLTCANIALPPAIEVDPAEIVATQPVTSAVSYPLTISNVGEDDLNWTIDEEAPPGGNTPGDHSRTVAVFNSTCSSPSDITWVTLSDTSGTTSGGGSDEVMVTFDPTGLMAGNTYTGSLCINSNDPLSPLVTVPLTLTVEGDPAIVITKTVGTTAGVCATMGSITVVEGTAVYYCVTVTNTGNVALDLHDLVDDQLGTLVTGLAYDLLPGASVDTVAAGLTISATLNVTTTNTATWTAYNVGPRNVVTATAVATVNVTPAPSPGYLIYLPIIVKP